MHQLTLHFPIIIFQDYLDFLALIKLFINACNATKEVHNIIETRKIAMLSALSIAPFNGINNEIDNNNVNNTIICEISLFSFFRPFENNNKIVPNKIGINEVKEPVDKNRYGYAPQKPNAINVMLFIRFDL